MALQQPAYTVEDFGYNGVVDGQLVAVVDKEGSIVGTCLLRRRSSNRLIVTINSVEYGFDGTGNPVSDNAVEAGYSLKIGKSQVDPLKSGTVGTTYNAVTRTIDSKGVITYTPSDTLDASYEITIDNLNARDQFAIHALRGMMGRLGDPSEVSDDVITHYCEAAYQWASFMMAESSKARAVIKDAETSTEAQTEEVGYLSTNMEKLLQNIVVMLENTKEAIKDLTKAIDNLRKDNQSGMKEIADAVSGN